MKKIFVPVVACVLLLSGCAASFQPFPPAVTEADFAKALKVRDENIMAVAQAVNELGKAKGAKSK